MVAQCIFPLNMKGGTGKTTVTVDIGYTLAKEGYRILFIDTDKQGATYKTLTRTTTVPPIDNHEEIFDNFINEPTKTTTLEDGYWYKGIDDYGVYLPTTADTAFFPVRLYTKNQEYADHYSEFIESIKVDYDFIIIDQQQYDPDDISIITENHEVFESLIPLIISEAAETEVENAKSTYRSFMKKIDKKGLSEKVNPLMIINKDDGTSYHHEEYDEGIDFFDLTRATNKIKPHINIDDKKISLYHIPNQKHASAARDLRSFFMDPQFNKNYISPDDIDPNEIDWSKESFDTLLSDPSPEDREHHEKQEDFMLYAEAIEKIAEKIESITGSKARQQNHYFKEDEKNRLVKEYDLKQKV